MSVDPLGFETEINELEGTISKLEKLSESNKVDLSAEIAQLQNKLESLRKDVYEGASAWEVTQIARHPQRPYTLDYIQAIFDDFVELHGGRQFPEDHAVVGGIAKLKGKPVVVIGHQKGRGTEEKIFRNFGMPHPEGYRKALRIMRFANRFLRPLILFIDTPGAYPGKEAEERGQGEAIARNIFEMSFLRCPVIAVVIGEGGSGGAVALGVGDRTLMLQHSIYSVISPEGCASILWKDVTKSETAANALKLTSTDLLELGVIDEIIEEPLGGAHHDYKMTFDNVKKAILRNLKEIGTLDPDERVKTRFDKYSKTGVFTEKS
jgi:acetyl-CoA carboxylase carboxyl transferase subunit alpha